MDNEVIKLIKILRLSSPYLETQSKQFAAHDDVRILFPW